MTSWTNWFPKLKMKNLRSIVTFLILLIRSFVKKWRPWCSKDAWLLLKQLRWQMIWFVEPKLRKILQWKKIQNEHNNNPPVLGRTWWQLFKKRWARRELWEINVFSSFFLSFILLDNKYIEQYNWITFQCIYLFISL